IGILFATQLGLPAGAVLLTAVQILYVNLLTDGLPAIALALEPIELGVMKRRPRRRGEGVFTPTVLRFIGVGGVWSCVMCLGTFLWAMHSGRSFLEAQTMCFVTLVLIQFVKAFNFRSLEESIFKMSPFTNNWLIGANLIGCILLVLIIYLPSLQKPFGTYPLSIEDWVVVVLATLTVFVVLEITKSINRYLSPPGR
ncbi:unnamed protein product, partial [marine sediment metagenome]